jgi:WD40-like Beta Propeller Repeat
MWQIVAFSLIGAFMFAAQASAASIAYLKQGNVWIANPDGTGAYQVTLDGSPTSPYLGVSQSDDGTIVTNRGQQLFVLRQNGDVVRTIDTVLGNGNPAISPDGTLIAHEAFRNACGSFVTTGCLTTVLRGVDGTERGFLVGGFAQPSWAGNTRLFVDSGGMWTYAIGTAFNAMQQANWPFPPWTSLPPTLHDGEVTVASDKFAYLANSNQIVLASGGVFPTASTVECVFDAPAGVSFDSPSWAPDGTALTFAQGGSIWTMSVGPTLVSGCAGVVPTLVIPDGSLPDWGPANVNPGPRSATPPPGSGGATTLAVTLTAPKTGTIRALRKRGIKVTTSVSVACQGVVALVVLKPEAKRLKLGTKETIIAIAGPAALEAGAFSVTLKLTPKYARRLKGAKRMTAYVLSACAVGQAEPVTKLRKIVFKA